MSRPLVRSAGFALLSCMMFPLTATAQADAPQLTLYNEINLGGTPVTVTADVDNLDSVAAPAGTGGTANDYAWSVDAVGRWELCMDAGHMTGCRTVEGAMPNLGPDGGSVSSVRYLGPGRPRVAATRPPAAPAVTAPPRRAAAVPQRAPYSPAAAYRPEYGTDRFGNDYREFPLPQRTAWQACKTACDRDGRCEAWTAVPDRGDSGMCYLKNPAPAPNPDDCCISGKKGG